MKSAKGKHPPFTAWQQERLKAWLRIRKLDGAGDDGGDAYSAPAGPSLPTTAIRRLVRPFDHALKAGEIRLLTQRDVASSSIPRYVAVLKEWDESKFLIAPYSKYAVPATTGEIDTQRGHFALDTLQLWNARIIQGLALKSTWLVDEMSLEEVGEALAVFAHVLTGTPLPKHLVRRVGPPILEADDPRIAYQDEEAAAFKPLQSRSMLIQELLKAADEMEKDDSPRTATRVAEIPLAMAAEDGSPRSALLQGNDQLVAQLAQGAAKAIPAVMRHSARNLRLIKDGDRIVGHWLLPDSFPTDITGVAFLVHRLNGDLLGDATVSFDGENRLVRFLAPASERLLKLAPEDICIIVV